MLDDCAATDDRIDRNSVRPTKSGVNGPQPQVLALPPVGSARAKKHYCSEFFWSEEIQPDTGTAPDADTTFEIGDGEFFNFEIDP